jgi:hypothetical protein
VCAQEEHAEEECAEEERDLHESPPLPTLVQGPARACLISADIGREIAEFVASRLVHHDVNIQHLAVQKFLGHSCMKGMIPPWRSNLDTIKLQHYVLSSLIEGVRDHLVGVRQSKLVMAKDILYTLASLSQVGSRRGVVGLFGVDRRNITKGRSRRLILDDGQDAFWLQYRRKIHSDSLAEPMKAMVKEWWANKTTVFPNCKDIVSVHKGCMDWVSHPTHFLQCS